MMNAQAHTYTEYTVRNTNPMHNTLHTHKYTRKLTYPIVIVVQQWVNYYIKLLFIRSFIYK